ncbi:vegetative cell wall protein gp1-like [Oxyura jamaicensis]|uniref:vegetative cell wall protein gp1-like n=1 Tax=Oxyura jamaicensis TaxID=8884 RepID=UPI0015A54654|nr:vegetative cell wall protein gp1-like [Oxyura jamaicensis]
MLSHVQDLSSSCAQDEPRALGGAPSMAKRAGAKTLGQQLPISCSRLLIAAQPPPRLAPCAPAPPPPHLPSPTASADQHQPVPQPQFLPSQTPRGQTLPGRSAQGSLLPTGKPRRERSIPPRAHPHPRRHEHGTEGSHTHGCSPRDALPPALHRSRPRGDAQHGWKMPSPSPGPVSSLECSSPASPCPVAVDACQEHTLQPLGCQELLCFPPPSPLPPLLPPPPSTLPTIIPSPGTLRPWGCPGPGSPRAGCPPPRDAQEAPRSHGSTQLHRARPRPSRVRCRIRPQHPARRGAANALLEVTSTAFCRP